MYSGQVKNTHVSYQSVDFLILAYNENAEKYESYILIAFQVLDDHPYALYKSAQNVYRENQNWTKSFLLGSGAFSTCYQARDVQSGTLMAVKQIPLNRGQDDDEKVKISNLLRVFFA